MSRSRGFTLVELIVVMAIALLMASLIWTSIWGGQHQTAINSTLTTFMSDIRAQQAKAMYLDTEGRSLPDAYGLYLSSSQYVLFHGSTYSPSDPADFTLDLDPNLILTTTFPSAVIIFQPGSGEVSGFTPGSNTVTFADKTNSVIKTITINKYGVIVSQN